jgi:aminomethyltransferase
MGRRRSPYYGKYLELGAELVDRMGYDAPYRFSTIEAEHMATRTSAGLYDVYHQGMVDIKGKDAETLLQRTCVNDLARIGDGEVLYSSICNDRGGMIDDLTIYRVAADHFFLSPTPTRVEAIVTYLTEQARELQHAYVTDKVSGTGFISVQGPNSRNIVGKLTDADLSTAALPYYSFTEAALADVPGILARTGYSGELGYEFFYPVEYGMYMWESVFAAGQDYGLVPCGLGALRSIRMEKRYPLYGLDLDESTSPVEANLGWTVRLDKGDFIGREVLARQKAQGVERQLVAIEFDGLEFLPTTGDAVTVNGEAIGKITSADRGFYVGRSIALGYLQPDFAATGTSVVVTDKTGAQAIGTVNQRAAYDPDREKVRA